MIPGPLVNLEESIMDPHEKTETSPSPPGQRRRLIGNRGSHFLEQMTGETRTNISACYQCERCTNACPVSHYMDIKPHQVIRFIQLGWREELLRSSTIWVCLSCEMCTTYCPNEVDVAELNNHLRNLAAHSSIPPRERALAVFHQTFMEQLHKFGRINEFRLINAYNLKPGILADKIKSGSLKEEVLLGLSLWKKGKLKLLPRKSRAIREIRDLYRQKRGDIV